MKVAEDHICIGLMSVVFVHAKERVEVPFVVVEVERVIYLCHKSCAFLRKHVGC